MPPGNPSHLAQRARGQDERLHDRPYDFVAWLEKQTDLPIAGPLTRGDIRSPGRWFGDYVRHLLNQEIKTPTHATNLELAHGDALSIEPCRR